MYTERNTTHTAMKQTKWSSPLKSRCALSLFGWGRLQHWWKATSPILIGSWRELLATELLPIILVALFDIHDLLVGVFRDQGKRNWLVLCGVQNVLPSPGIFHNVGQKKRKTGNGVEERKRNMQRRMSNWLLRAVLLPKKHTLWWQMMDRSLAFTIFYSLMNMSSQICIRKDVRDIMIMVCSTIIRNTVWSYSCFE